MALVGQALVMVIARALAQRTWAEGRVYEQPVNPLNQAFRNNQDIGKPAIAIYVETTDTESWGMELSHGVQKATTKIVVYCPPKIKFVAGTDTVEFDSNSAGLVLRLVQRQVLAALQYGDTPWVSLLRRLVAKSTGYKSRFLLIEPEDGVRIPSVEISLDLECVPEPAIGRPLNGPWLQLDGLLRAEEEDAVADFFKAAIIEPQGLPEWAIVQSNLNVSDAAYLAMGLKPLAVDDDGEAVVLEDVGLDIQVEIAPPVL